MAMVLDRLAHSTAVSSASCQGFDSRAGRPRRGSPRAIATLKSAAAVSISRIASGTCCLKRPEQLDAVEVRHHVVRDSGDRKVSLFRGLMRVGVGDDGVASFCRIRVNACKMSASSSTTRIFVMGGIAAYYAFFATGR